MALINERDMYREITNCRCCDSDQLTEVLNLGKQPLANSFHEKGEILSEFPLALNICNECNHGQLSVVVDPDLMFKDYLYVSGTSQTLRDYFEWFADYVIERVEIAGLHGRVLDIACNDGSQLDAFKARGWFTYGIDPAENLHMTVIDKDHVAICDYLNKTNIQFAGVKYDAIIAQNVFAHVDDVLGFLESCKLGMHEKTRLFIQTSQANMFLNNEFDTIYHEHLSFFNTDSMWRVVNRAGLKLYDVSKTPIHGTSYLFEIGLPDSDDLLTSEIDEALYHEQAAGLWDMETYIKFGQNAMKCLSELKKGIDYFRSKGNKVIGYGAAAKGMTLLNAGNIILDGIVDDNPLKHGLYTPGSNIRIYPPSVIKPYDPNTFEFDPYFIDKDIVIIPLAWNFFDEIYKKVKEMRPRNSDIFIKYFPEIEYRCG